MPSFDIISKVDLQKLDNAINTVKKEIVNRYDFHNSKTSIELDKKLLNIHVVTEHDMGMETIKGIIISRMMKQGLDSTCLDWGKEQYASGNMIKKDVKVKEGIDKDNARKIVKVIKESKMKVQASIMDEHVRVTGKKLDDLQACMSLAKAADIGIPLQFDNFRN